MTDHEWQTQCEDAKAGDQQAYQALFDELEPRLYAYVRSRVFEAEQAADVVQETLIAFFQSCTDFYLYNHATALSVCIYYRTSAISTDI